MELERHCGGAAASPVQASAGVPHGPKVHVAASLIGVSGAGEPDTPAFYGFLRLRRGT